MGNMWRMQDYWLGSYLGHLQGRSLEAIHPKTWKEYVREDSIHVSEIGGLRCTFIDWWSSCKDMGAWTNIIEMEVEIHT